MSKGTDMNKHWGSHNRSSHSVYKSIPKMESERKVKKVFNKGTEYEATVDLIEGFGTISRHLKKKMHKKKRRQIFKKLIDSDIES